MYCTKVCTSCQQKLLASNEYFDVLKNGKYGLNPVCKQCRKQYYQSNRNHILKRVNQYRNKPENKIKRNLYQKRKMKSDKEYHIKHILRTRIGKVLKKTSKSKSTLELLGCSLTDLLQHIEKQFTDGMNWKNYGKWHIDHIIPCASFDLADPEQQKKCFHYSNLQPLWAVDNIRKSDKVLDNEQ